MQQIERSEGTAAERRVPIHLVDATDGLTPEAGITPAVAQVSIAGAAFANTTNSIVEIANGAYYIELTAAEVATDGVRIIRFKDTETAEFQTAIQVVTRLQGHGWAEGTDTPGKDASIEAKIEWLFQTVRNQRTVSDTVDRVRNNAGTVLSQATVSQSSGTFTKAKFADPPA